MRFINLCFLVSTALLADEFSDYPTGFAEEETFFEEVVNPDWIDLEALVQDFVLETRRIEIEGYPDAFNPSIVRWNGELLMLFRSYDPLTRSTNGVSLIYLDEECRPIGASYSIQFHSPDPYCLSKRQDPRLITVGERLYLVYNNALEGELRRMCIAELKRGGEGFFVEASECLLHFDGAKEWRSEKNWVPFNYNGELYLSRHIAPHTVLRPICGEGRCELIATTPAATDWNWGILRGGTPALLEGEEYLAFFHSSKTMATQHSQGKKMPHYFMGAYTFSSKPPFEITRMSREPIFGKSFYAGRAYKTWRPVRVVFPGGFVADENYVWIIYGRQDHEIWVAKLDKRALLDGLVPVGE